MYSLYISCFRNRTGNRVRLNFGPDLHFLCSFVSLALKSGLDLNHVFGGRENERRGDPPTDYVRGLHTAHSTLVKTFI